MILDEALSIQGIPLDPETIPPGTSLTLDPIWAEEEVVLLNGATRRYQGDQRGGWRIELAPPDTYAVPLAIKKAVEAAYAARQPVTIRETLSDPEAERVWTGVPTERPVFTEVPGTGRTLYTYSIKLFQEE